MPAFDEIYVIMVGGLPALAFWEKNDAKRWREHLIRKGNSKDLITIEKSWIQDPAIYVKELCDKNGLKVESLNNLKIVSDIGNAIKALANVGHLSFIKYLQSFFKGELYLLYQRYSDPYSFVSGSIQGIKEEPLETETWSMPF